MDRLLSNSVTHDPEVVFDEVESYYLDHCHTLPLRTQFHFLSRLYLWSGEERYLQRLEVLRSEWFTDSGVIMSAAVRGVDCKVSKRRPYRYEYSRRYGEIYLYNRLLFRMMFARTVFASEAFEISDSVDREAMLHLRNELLQDRQAIRLLTTSAVNFLYLSGRYLQEETSDLCSYLLEISKEESGLDQKSDLDALVSSYACGY